MKESCSVCGGVGSLQEHGVCWQCNGDGHVVRVGERVMLEREYNAYLDDEYAYDDE